MTGGRIRLTNTADLAGRTSTAGRQQVRGRETETALDQRKPAAVATLGLSDMCRKLCWEFLSCRSMFAFHKCIDLLLMKHSLSKCCGKKGKFKGCGWSIIYCSQYSQIQLMPLICGTSAQTSNSKSAACGEGERGRHRCHCDTIRQDCTT